MMDRLTQAVRTVPDFPSPGIQFKDITPILADPKLLRFAVDSLADPYRKAGITKVIGIEARGFILGAMLADELDADWETPDSSTFTGPIFLPVNPFSSNMCNFSSFIKETYLP